MREHRHLTIEVKDLALAALESEIRGDGRAASGKDGQLDLRHPDKKASKPQSQKARNPAQCFSRNLRLIPFAIIPRSGCLSLRWAELDEAFSVKTSGALVSDVTLFSALVDATMNRREITFEYHKLDADQAEQRHIQPYHVGQLQNGWYLIGKDLARQEMRTFALQRLRKLTVLKSRFKRDPSFNMRDYQSSGFGVWSYRLDAELFDVRIRFSGWAARVVAERQWHPTQKIRQMAEPGAEIEFQAQLAGLEEITRWVLGWGSLARVLGPTELKQRLKTELERMLPFLGDG